MLKRCHRDRGLEPTYAGMPISTKPMFSLHQNAILRSKTHVAATSTTLDATQKSFVLVQDLYLNLKIVAHRDAIRWQPDGHKTAKIGPGRDRLYIRNVGTNAKNGLVMTTSIAMRRCCVRCTCKFICHINPAPKRSKMVSQ